VCSSDLIIEMNTLANLDGTNISFIIEGDNAYIASSLDRHVFNNIEWDYTWNFSAGIPEYLIGDAYYDSINECTYFNGSSELILPNSVRDFDRSPLTIFVEWTPYSMDSNDQQIIGTYKWEIYQNTDSVSFRVGRMNTRSGPFFTAISRMSTQDISKKQSIIASYLPSKQPNQSRIELIHNNMLRDFVYIGDNVIYRGYGNHDLSMGRSKHGGGKIFFHGCIHHISISLNSYNLYDFHNNYTYGSNSNNRLFLLLGYESVLRSIEANIIR